MGSKDLLFAIPYVLYNRTCQLQFTELQLEFCRFEFAVRWRQVQLRAEHRCASWSDHARSRSK